MKRTAVLIFTLAVGCSAHYRANVVSGTGETICPPPISGEYRNFNYGFTLTIPDGLEANWNSIPCVPEGDGCVCMSDHGRTISLGRNADLQIWAQHNSLFITLPTAVFNELEYFRRDIDDLDFSVEELGAATLSDLPAFHYQASRTKHDLTVKREGIIALSKDGGMIYSVHLQAPEAEFENYKEHFLSIVASWHATPRE